MTTPESPLLAMMTPERLADPYAFYRQLRAIDPVLRAPAFGVGAWLVTSHAIASSVLRAKEGFGKEGEKVLPPEVLAQIPQQTSDISERRRHNMLFVDPPAHTRLRGLVSQAFTPRQVERLRPRIAEIAASLLDEAGSSFDLIRDFAFPLPIIVIAELLGVPPEDKQRFKAWSTDLTRGLEPSATADDFEKVARALEAFDAYMSEVIEERRRAPRADLISAMVAVHEQGDRLSRIELLATCRLLLTAGHETTVNLIGNGTLALLRNPGERDALAAEPARIEGAVEELLRFDSPVQLTMRFAYEDGELGAHAAKKGDVVVLMLGAANHDPALFGDPDRLDVRRANADKHLAFGGGIHFCLGAPLARLEGEIAIDALVRRFPHLALAGEPAWRKNLVLRGLASLPVGA